MNCRKGKGTKWLLALLLAPLVPRGGKLPGAARILGIGMALLAGGWLGHAVGIRLGSGGWLLSLPTALLCAYLVAHVGVRRAPGRAQGMMKTELGVTGREQPPRKPRGLIKAMRFEGRSGQIKNPSLSLADQLGSLPSQKSEHIQGEPE